MASESRHVVAVIGGAVSGSEAAATFADRGMTVAVFEQNSRPYGKIEDGLPRWHDKQRPQEYQRINERLTQAGVHFVPSTKLGRDVPFEEFRSWGWSAVVLANGAWRDRPLEVPGVDEFLGKGLYYQNPLVYWFNHYCEKGYSGPRFDLTDDAMVIGGGLASIDVVKIVMLETVGRALSARGQGVDMLTMEKRGVSAILAEKKLTLADLGLKGCTLYYRRRALDMPVAAYKDNATPEERKKTEDIRERLVRLAMDKFLFRFQPLHLPLKAVVEGGRLVGLVFQRTEIRDGKVIKLPGTEVEIRAPLIISSIGSIPEGIAGIPLKGEMFQFPNQDTGELAGFPGVYGLGNVVTGKGNIAVSRRHAASVSAHIIANYLGVGDGKGQPASLYEGAASTAAARAQKTADAIAARPPLSGQQVEALMQRIKTAQAKVGYSGDFKAWMKKVSPEDLA